MIPLQTGCNLVVLQQLYKLIDWIRGNDVLLLSWTYDHESKSTCIAPLVGFATCSREWCDCTNRAFHPQSSTSATPTRHRSPRPSCNLVSPTVTFLSSSYNSRPSRWPSSIWTTNDAHSRSPCQCYPLINFFKIIYMSIHLVGMPNWLVWWCFGLLPHMIDTSPHSNDRCWVSFPNNIHVTIVLELLHCRVHHLPCKFLRNHLHLQCSHNQVNQHIPFRGIY